MFVKTKSHGPLDAKIMLIGEAPGAEEAVRGIPFVGTSGQELNRMLHEVGIVREECFLTNACKYRPPGNDIDTFFLDSKRQKPNELLKESLAELQAEISEVKPELIIALGDTALWALTGNHGITKWRGSQLEYNGIKLVPTYHPALILREWSWRAIAVHDLRRAIGWLEGRHQPPIYNHIVRPTHVQVLDCLALLLAKANSLPDGESLPLAVDLETRAGHIACTGIAWSRVDAICIPDLCVERPTGYWTLAEDLEIWIKLKELLTHEKVEVIGQNFLYDAQYFARRRGYVPRLRHDTMLQQHVVWAGLPKGLDFLASMYCDYYQYWKDESKDWDPKIGEDQLWIYNCKDSCATLEVHQVLKEAVRANDLGDVYNFQMTLWWSVLRMMLRGVNINASLKNQIAGELVDAMNKHQQEINFITGRELNVGSYKQMQSMLYGELKLPVQRQRKTRRPTTDDSALEKLKQLQPLLTPLIQRIQNLRSLGVFLRNFIQAPLDPDGRMRCSFNPAGTETFRFSSSESAFGTGTNLQNIPSGDEDDEGKTEKLLPNIRKLFIPDPGYTIADIDLAGADAQVVAWEASDDKLKATFRAGLKVHAVNAKDIFGDLAGPDGRAMPYYHRAKTGVHLTNYGGSARTCAGALGIPEWEAKRFQERWFTIHPEIAEWHDATEHLLQTKRQVTNKFGYRRFYFDRVEGLLPEALAWVPQSTVACVCNRALVKIDLDTRLQALGVQLLLQVHDSLVIQYPTHNETAALKLLQQIILVPVPYDDQLTIPWGLKTSRKSWGDCQPRPWPEN